MFEHITPEEAGITSARVLEYIERLERNGLAMHSVLIAKGDKLLCEAYWKPFDKDFNHRMYSQTKSYTAIAIGLLEEDGKLSLDDKIADHFPELIENELHPYMAELTIRDMLKMETTGAGANWFNSADPDRTHLYFNGQSPLYRPSTIYRYDSAGSQVLASLVDKLAGKPMFDFMYERIFRHLGTFQNATILKTRNGATWGDSALVCTSRDMLSFARFLMKGGVWEGKRLMNEEFIKTATSRLTDNNITGFRRYNAHGYGYQIWRWERGFGFNGMGCQYTVCVPESDLTFVCTADNQGDLGAGEVIIGGFFDCIVRPAVAKPLPADPINNRALNELLSSLTLVTACGEPTSPIIEKINGRTYVAEQNSTGITRFGFFFNPDGTGEFRYTNAQGDKVIYFGLGKNVFAKFPELGYSDGFGGVRTTNGFMYDCAASAAFGMEDLLQLRVQIIDRYFGNMSARFGFRDGDVTVCMVKTAEDFLGAYQGTFVAHAEQE